MNPDAELVNTEELAHCLQDGGIDITHDEVLSWLRSRGYQFRLHRCIQGYSGLVCPEHV